MATLAAILVVVAYHMSEWRTFRAELRAPKSDVAVLLTTFLLTVLVDLTVAIMVGMVLAAFLFMRRMAEVTNVTAVTRELTARRGRRRAIDRPHNRRAIPPGVEVYEINGPFFFGAAEIFKETLGVVAGRPRVLIMRMRECCGAGFDRAACAEGHRASQPAGRDDRVDRRSSTAAAYSVGSVDGPGGGRLRESASQCRRGD